MREYPILFSSPMVRALWNTRLNTSPPQPIDPTRPCKGVTRRLSKQWLKVKAGDRLWVRETHAIVGIDWPRTVRVARAERMPAGKTLADTDGGLDLIELEDENLDMMPWFEEHIDSERWRPSIFMPRCLCRILLECLEDARPEHLQQITEEDACLEGLKNFPNSTGDHWGLGPADCWEMTARGAFKRLWGTLHTKPGERWEDDPELVRVGPFRRVA